VEYLVDLSIHFDTGAVHEGLGCDGRRNDHCQLIAIRGIGRWTARDVPDLLPDATQRAASDVGLINGISQNYFWRVWSSQRRTRGGGCLGSLLQRGNLVYLAIAGPSDTGAMTAPAAFRPATI
jgi:hypothetical protein